MEKQKPLTKKQIKEAAESGTQVRFVITHNDSYYENTDCLVVPNFTEEKGIEYCNLNNLNGSLAYKLDIRGLTEEEPFYWVRNHLTSGIYSKDTGEIFDLRRERLAKFVHEDVWAHWMKYLFSRGTITPLEGQLSFYEENEPAKVDKGTYCLSPSNVERWKRQMNTDYEDLPEDEKKSDRELADKLMKLLEE